MAPGRTTFTESYTNLKVFEEDAILGRRFRDGRLITSNGFETLAETIMRIKRNDGAEVFLNMGDSSTSGWDGNKVFAVDKHPLAPLFTYKTYSALIEARLSPNVINAGVPAYSSYQGQIYLKELLARLSLEGVKVDYVTIYFGNNDCCCGTEVTIENYIRHLELMITLSKEHGAKPILIVPPVHYDWEPGVVSAEDRVKSLEKLGEFELENPTLLFELTLSRLFYNLNLFELACEWDRYLPRLKKEYRHTLFQVAKETGTDMINVQDQIPLTNNSEYFVDYCYPLEKTNQMIVDRIREIVERNID